MAQSEIQMAHLKNELQMPLIVRDLLVTDQAPDAEANYALHEMMGNFQPDAALLCSAFVMKEIASYEAIISTDLAFLKMECDRLMERYCARDDLAEENPDLWSETQSEMMGVIAEDMEGFLELISLCHLSFEITNPNIAKFLDIITTQLQSHLMIVDEVIYLQATVKRQATLSHPSITGYKADNVVMFPG